MKFIRRTPGGHRAQIAACLLLAACFGAGCQAPGPRLIRGTSAPFATGNTALHNISGEQEIAEARRLLRAGDHALVIPRLTALSGQYAGTPAGAEAWFLLGEAYREIDGPENAVRCYRAYLEIEPRGPFAGAAHGHLAALEASAREGAGRRAELEARVEKLGGVETPEALSANLDLADACWRAGDFEEAAEVYVRILKAWPALHDDATLRFRMEFRPDGTYTVLTPEEVARREAAALPLTLFNIQSFRSGGYRSERFGREDEYYNVTGQATNRGQRPVWDAVVTITIYGMGGQVYDTQTVQLGRLKPGEVRAFSARFRHFDNIENVHRHECTVSYSQ